MLEQTQSAPTESVMLAAAKGKSGKQGVFANLFKALASKGIAGGVAAEGKAGAASLAKALAGNLKAGAGAQAGQDGTSLAKALAGNLKAQAGSKAGEEEQGESIKAAAIKAAALQATSGKKAARAGDAESKSLNAAKESASRTSASRTPIGKAAAGGAFVNQATANQAATDRAAINKAAMNGTAINGAEADEQPLSSGSVRRAGLSDHPSHAKSDRHAVGDAPQVREEHAVTANTKAGKTAHHDDEQDPDIGIAQARSVAASTAQADTRASDRAASQAAVRGTAFAMAQPADKQGVEGTHPDPHAQAGDTLPGDSEAIRQDADKAGRRHFALASGKTAAPEHEARIPNQAGAIDHDALQHDTDTVQRIREELAAMANRAAGKAVRTNRAKLSGKDPQVTAAQAGTQANHAHPQTQQASAAAQQAAPTQTAQAATAAAVAAGTGQQGSGQDAGSRHESGDNRLAGTVQNDARPQQAFDLQQQAAARMAQPMRALEAMQAIAQSAAAGTTKLELQLEPAHLGKIHISLQTDATKQLQMHLTVEQTVTRQVIEQHMPQLRAALEQQGLNLDNFSLHTGSQGQQQQQAFEHAPNAEKGDNDYALDSSPDPGTATASASASSRLSIHI